MPTNEQAIHQADLWIELIHEENEEKAITETHEDKEENDEH